MAKTSPDLTVGAASGELAHGSLRLWDAIAISVSVIAPGMAMLLNVSGVSFVAGGSTPLAFLLGGVACLALAFVVIGFTRRMATAGYAYTYASRSLGKEAGFMAGWLYFFGFICFVPMTMSGVGYLAADLLKVSPKLWILFFFIGMCLFLVLSVIRIKVTTRVQLIVGIITVAIIVLIDLITTAKGGSHGQALSAFSFSHTNSGGFNGVFYGIIFGVTSYIGFETAADFGEETAHPRRYIPIAVITATLFAIILYLWTTYSITIGYGVTNGTKMGADPVALKTTATTFVGSWLGTLAEIGGMCAAFIVCVACATAAARTLFAMGREGVLPAAFAKTHPTIQDPGQRHAGGHRARHLDGAADGLPALGQHVRAAAVQLLLLGDHRHAADHRGLHPAVHRRHRVLLEHPRHQELESAGARRHPGRRRNRVRRCSLRLDPPGATGHPQVDTTRCRSLAGGRDLRAAVAPGAAA